jgi:hypothetical protein
MAQSIGLVTKFMPILDEVYKFASVTARMDAMTKPVDFAGASVVEIFTTTPIGLGTYSRALGYPKGQVVGAWESFTLAAQRGREFNIDRMDNEESLGMAFGTLVGEFIRTQVAPEIDAYRFAKYAGTGSIQTVTGATLASNSIIAAVDAAKAALNAYEVPMEGRLLYMSSLCKGYLEQAISRTLGNDNTADRRLRFFDGMEIVEVPAGRFYTIVTLDSGSGGVDAGGFSNGGVGINFMLLHPSAVIQATKLAKLKIFSPDENQDYDAWKFQYRLYHDAFVYPQKVKGVYLHKLGA